MIDKEKVIYFHKYEADESGRVFKLNGEIYREIYPNYVEEVKELFKSGAISELIDRKLLIDTKMTELHLQEGDLILQHEFVPVCTHAYEWSYGMIADAGKLVVEILHVLNKYGYELKDCHTENILFIHNTPVFVDFGSIILNKRQGKPVCDLEFLVTYCCPLIMSNTKYEGVVRSLYKTNSLMENRELLFKLSNIKLSKYKNWLDDVQWKLLYDDFNPTSKKWKIASKIGTVLKSTYFISQNKLDQRRIKCIRKYEQILNTNCKFHKSTKWEDYYENESVQNRRFDILIEKIIEYDKQINTIWEIGANSGLFAKKLKKRCNIKSYIVTDYDMNAVEKCYQRFKNNNVYVANVDVNEVYWDCLGGNEIERFRSDLVIALALLHHLILSQKLNIRWIVKMLYDATNAYVLTEFVPLGLWNGTDHDISVPVWYTYDWFLQEMEVYFDILWEEKTEKNRISVLLKKKT